MKQKLYIVPDSFDSASRHTLDSSKSTLIIVQEEELNHITLQKMLTAVKLSEGDILYISPKEGESVNVSSIIGESDISNVLVFGYGAPTVGFHINEALYHTYTIGKIKLLFSDSILSLDQDKNKKMALWKCLQSMFGI